MNGQTSDSRAPSLVDVVKKKSLRPSDTVFTTIRDLQTIGGTKAKGFSKHRKFGAGKFNFISNPGVRYVNV